MIKSRKYSYQESKILPLVERIANYYKQDPKLLRAVVMQHYPELADKKHCANCGANMKSFWHSLNSGLVGIMIQAIKFVRQKDINEFHLQKDLHLSVNQFSNFTKLRFHGLVTKVKNKPGYWLITKRGGEFLRGEINIPDSVHTFRNSVIGHSQTLTNIKDFKGDFPSFQSEYAMEIRQGRLI